MNTLIVFKDNQDVHIDEDWEIKGSCVPVPRVGEYVWHKSVYYKVEGVYWSYEDDGTGMLCFVTIIVSPE